MSAAKDEVQFSYELRSDRFDGKQSLYITGTRGNHSVTYRLNRYTWEAGMKEDQVNQTLPELDALRDTIRKEVNALHDEEVSEWYDNG